MKPFMLAAGIGWPTDECREGGYSTSRLMNIGRTSIALAQGAGSGYHVGCATDGVMR